MLKIKNYSISLVISFVIVSILICLSAVIFAYTSIQDRHLQAFVFGAILISNIIGALILTRKIKEKGILHGGIFGIIFCLILYIISVSSYNGFFISQTLGLYFAVCIVSGIIGGVIGVNI